MTYEQFVEHRIAQGETPEQIAAEVTKATRPISGRCAFCGNEATLLCDYIIGWTNMQLAKPKNLPPYWAFTTIGKNHSHPLTCDTPLCENCVNNRGLTFYNGGKEYTGCESEDWCPDHHDDTGTKRPVPMTEEEVEAHRRRRRMQLVNKCR